MARPIGRPKLLDDPRRVVITIESRVYTGLERMLAEYRREFPEAQMPALLRKILGEATRRYRRAPTAKAAPAA